MFDNIFCVTFNSDTSTQATLIILIIDGMNNMNNLSNLNSMEIGMSNISNRNRGNPGDHLRNEMANVGGMHGVREEKFKSNVFGDHHNLYPTDYLHFDFFKTKGSTPNFTNIVRYNNDNINSSNNSNNNNGGNNMNNLNTLGNVSNWNNLNDGNTGAGNLTGGIGNDFLVLVIYMKHTT